MDQINTQQPFSWTQVAQNIVSSIPYILTQIKSQPQTQAQVEEQPVFSQVEKREPMKWANPFRLAGLYLIGDGIISIATHKTEKPAAHLPRLIRAGIGYWLFRYPPIR